jgi:hypothetical protein
LAAVFSDPGLNTVGFLCYLENTSTLAHAFWAIATKAGLAAISEVNSLVFAPVVIVVIMTTRDPLYCLLFN